MVSLLHRTLAGFGWRGATQSLTQAFQFGVSILLAHLLGPHEFGLVAMVWVLTGFASVLVDMGLGAAIIQRQELSQGHLSSAFWINVAIASILTGAFVAAAPLVAGFYDEPRLRLLTVALSFNFVLTALSAVQLSLLDRSLDFRRKFWIEMAAAVSSGAVAVFLAVFGAGVWSIVAQSLVAGIARFGASWRLSDWRPAWSLERRASEELLRYGWKLAGSWTISYWGRNIDRLLLGRLLGTAPLGVYSAAFRLIALPLDLTTDVINNVMFPALSSIQEDRKTIAAVYLRSTRMIALVTFPMMIGFAALAEPAVLLVLGERWRASIGVIQLLAFSGMAQSVYNTASWLFMSQGRTTLILRLGVYTAAVRVAGAAIGVRWGVIGVALAYVVGSLVFLWYPVWRSAGSLIGIRYSRLMRNIEGPFLCAAGMGAVVVLLDRWLSAHAAPALRVAAGMIVGTGVYASLVQGSRLEAWHDLRRIVLRVGGQSFPILVRVLGDEPTLRSETG